MNNKYRLEFKDIVTVLLLQYEDIFYFNSNQETLNTVLMCKGT